MTPRRVRPCSPCTFPPSIAVISVVIWWLWRRAAARLRTTRRPRYPMCGHCRFVKTEWRRCWMRATRLPQTSAIPLNTSWPTIGLPGNLHGWTPKWVGMLRPVPGCWNWQTGWRRSECKPSTDFYTTPNGVCCTLATGWPSNNVMLVFMTCWRLNPA